MNTQKEKIAFEMSNEELYEAIDATYDMICDPNINKSILDLLIKHFEFLVSIQSFRAGSMSINPCKD